MNMTNQNINLSNEIPDKEPERQYYYIEKAKEYIQKNPRRLDDRLPFV